MTLKPFVCKLDLLHLGELSCFISSDIKKSTKYTLLISTLVKMRQVEFIAFCGVNFISEQSFSPSALIISDMVFSTCSAKRY